MVIVFFNFLFCKILTSISSESIAWLADDAGWKGSSLICLSTIELPNVAFATFWKASELQFFQLHDMVIHCDHSEVTVKWCCILDLPKLGYLFHQKKTDDPEVHPFSYLFIQIIILLCF